MATKKLTYESGIEELSDLIERIESGELSLEETVKAYEKGNELTRKLSAMLEEGKGRLLKLSENGSEVPLDDAEEEA